MSEPSIHAELGRILEFSRNEIYVIDAESLQFVHVNRGACENLAYSMAELRTMTPLDLKPAYTPVRFQNLLAPLLQGRTEKITFETEHLRKDGTLYPVEVQLQQSTLADTPVYVAVINDITERRRRAAYLQASISRMQALIGNQQGAVLVEDEHRHIVLVNQRFCDLFGISEAPDQLVGLEYVKVARAALPFFKDPEAFEQRAAAVLAERRHVVGETLVMADGRTLERDFVPIFERDRYRGHYWLYRDVTRHVAAEEEIRKLALVARETDNAVVITDKTGFIEWVNEGFTRMTGYTLEEAVGRKPGEFLQGEETDTDTVNWIRQAVRNREKVRAEIINYTKSGRKHWVELYIQPVFDEHGEVQRYIAIENDVTERKMADEALLNSRSRLKLLNDIATGISPSMSVDDVMAHTLEQVHRAFPKYRVAYSVIDDQGWQHTLYDQGPHHLPRLTGLRVDLTHASAFLEGMWKGMPGLYSDLPHDGRFLRLRKLMENRKIHAMLAIPLRHDWNHTGVLCFQTDRPHVWSEHEVFALKDVADYLSVALRQASAEEERRAAESALAEQKQALETFSRQLKTLHGLHTGKYAIAEELLQAYLQKGCEIFGVSTGIISRVEGGTYRIRAVHSNIDMLRPEMTFPIEETYCSAVIGQRRTIAYPHVGALPEMHHHPVYQSLKLETYLGTPILVNGGVFGTLNYSCTRVRQAPFSGHEMEIIEMLADSIGRFLELERADRELLQTHEELDSFFNLSPELLCIAGTDGYLKRINPAWSEVLGHEESDLVTRPLIEWVHPDDQDKTRVQLDALAAGGTTLYFKNRLRTYDGQYRWLEWTARSTKEETVYIVAQDVTERKKLNDLLRETQAMAAVGGWEVDLDTLQSTWTEETYRIHELAVGTPVDVQSGINFYHPEDRPKIMEAIDRCIQLGEGWDLEARLITARNREVWVRAIGKAHFRNGIPFRLTGTFQDVTELKKVERLKNEFVSMVSHELRTPLTSISGSLGLIAGGATGALPAQARTMIEIAHRNSERLVRLINDMLDMQKIEAGQMTLRLKPLDLGVLLQQAVEVNRSYGEKYGVTFHLHPVEEKVPVEADADRILQVMTNLLSNAAKFSPPDRPVEIELKRTDRGCRVNVSDRGDGISETFQQQIFQKFAQADGSNSRQMEGTGLGLSISKSIVEMHGGQIGFVTTPGEGTTFYFELPGPVDTRGGDLGGETWSPVLAAPQPAGEGAGDYRILHVEDDDDIAKVAEQILIEVAEVDSVQTLEGALQQLSEHRYHLVLLDLGLPDGDGRRLMSHLQYLGDTAPKVIIYSAQEVDQELATGAAAALLKSRTSGDRLRTTVLNVLEGRAARAIRPETTAHRGARERRRNGRPTIPSTLSKNGTDES